MSNTLTALMSITYQTHISHGLLSVCSCTHSALA